MTTTATTRPVTTASVYVIDGQFACSTCTPADTRDAVNARPAERRDFAGTRDAVTACCGERLTFLVDEVRVRA